MQTIRVFKFKVDSGKAAALKMVLSPLGSSNPQAHPDLPFNRLPMLHFASLTVFEDPTGDYGDELIFESSFDGTLDDYLEALVRVCGTSLENICEHCQGYPSPDGLVRYLKAHAIVPSLFHIGTPGRRVEHILNERNLRHAIDCDDILDNPKNARLPEHELREAIQESVAAPPSTRLNWYPRGETAPFCWVPEFAPSSVVGPVALLPLKMLVAAFGVFYLVVARALARVPYINIDRDQHWALTLRGHPGSNIFQRLFTWGKYGLVVVLVLVAQFFSFLGALVGKLRPPAEATNQLRSLPLKQRRQIRRLRRTEDRRGCIQNHLASIVRIRSGRFTKRWVRLKLRFLNAIYRTLFTRGTLAGVPGIHFGHWTLLDEGRDAHGRKDAGRMLFLSNYDGTWDNYLDDFIAKLGSGVGHIWGKSEGFPGVTDGTVFKNWARLQQTRTRVWYSAYPELTVEAINNHSEIREGLFAPIHQRKTLLKTWFLRFGQAGKSMRLEGESVKTEGRAKWIPFRDRGPAFDPRNPDIQGLLLKSYEPLKYSASIFFRITDRANAKLWLRDAVLGAVTNAGVKSADAAAAVNIGFTYSGLEALGLSEEELATFPSSFTEGMTEQRRRRILGDLATNDGRPSKWEWGGTRTPVDLVLLVFEDTEAKRNRARDLWTWSFEQGGCGHAVSHVDTYLSKREHFGFPDGISQPIIHGTDAARALSWQELRWHGVAPGEFVLGYVDGSGETCSPPSFGPKPMELGRNGSYMVIRQLSQDVRGFWRHLDDVARARVGNGNVEQAREDIAARLVGRTLGGDPLISEGAQLKREKGHRFQLAWLHMKFAWRALRRRTTVRWKAFRGVDEPKIVNEIRNDNSFGFRDDPDGFLCPVGAHVRRANPRDLLGDRRTTALEAANRRRILRRGRLYGDFLDRKDALDPIPADTVEKDRGLLFVCFNSDIERQFEFIQSQWINNAAFDGLYRETDGFVAAGFAGQGRITSQRDPLRERFLLESYVTARGGGYFFLPGIQALTHLAK